ncbi:MAG: hypothetical protein HY815_32375 [Candidatus Riflebacteria bacterium]|nr:hypothetical protein [Candidatus Riflebacteria bacterium]
MDPICRICGTEMSGVELVVCERCQTPHHQDCWEYWGRCATYGCDGLVAPPTGRAASPPAPVHLALMEDGPARFLPRAPLVDAVGVLMYSAEGAHITLGYREVAIQIPSGILFELPVRSLDLSPLVWLLLCLGSTVAAAGVIAFLAPPITSVKVLVGPVLVSAVVAIRQRMRHRVRAEACRAWLVRAENGELLVELEGQGGIVRNRLLNRHRYRLIPPWIGGQPLRARGVLLRPAFGDGAEREVVKAYRLQLACELPDGGLDLIYPLSVPGKGESRREFLEELTRVRALGQQVAGQLKVPYVEQGMEGAGVRAQSVAEPACRFGPVREGD